VVSVVVVSVVVVGAVVVVVAVVVLVAVGVAGGAGRQVEDVIDQGNCAVASQCSPLNGGRVLQRD